MNRNSEPRRGERARSRARERSHPGGTSCIRDACLAATRAAAPKTPSAIRLSARAHAKRARAPQIKCYPLGGQFDARDKASEDYIDDHRRRAYVDGWNDAIRWLTANGYAREKQTR